MCATQKLKDELYKKGKIAIHYTDFNDADLNETTCSKKGREIIRDLRKYCEQGPYVAADFGHQWLVGMIPPGTLCNLEEFPSGELNKCRHSGTDAAYFPEIGMHRYRTVQLTEVQKLEPPRAIYLALRPPHVCISGWPIIKDRIELTGTKQPIPENAESLLPSQQETMCYEWLKSKGVIDRLLLPIGRTLKTFDIVGIGPRAVDVYAPHKRVASQGCRDARGDRGGKKTRVVFLLFGSPPERCKVTTRL